MATGSRATAQHRLVEAHYKTRQPGLPGTQRCDTCRHEDEAFRRKQHGRHCTMHRVDVLTHGVCDAWSNKKPALAVAAATAELQREALTRATEVMLRMVPGYCAEVGVEQATDAEFDDALHRLVIAHYGADVSAWPDAVTKVISGQLG